MKKICALLLSVLLLTTKAQANENAIAFTKNLTDSIITNVLTSNKSSEEKLELFRSSFQPALDLKSIGQFVLGVYWRKATQQQKDAFLDAFIDFATKSWADKFNLYTGQQIEFKGTREAKSKQIYVDSIIQNNPPVEVIWRIKERNNEYKIVDIIVEGVSMAMSYRNEYTAFLQKNNGNLDTLTTELKTKSAAFKFSETPAK